MVANEAPATLTPYGRVILQLAIDDLAGTVARYPDELVAAIRQALATIDERPGA
jgi:hypothetical protein